jgi:hypothetical protein
LHLLSNERKTYTSHGQHTQPLKAPRNDKFTNGKQLTINRKVGTLFNLVNCTRYSYSNRNSLQYFVSCLIINGFAFSNNWKQSSFVHSNILNPSLIIFCHDEVKKPNFINLGLTHWPWYELKNLFIVNKHVKNMLPKCNGLVYGILCTIWRFFIKDQEINVGI